MKKVNFGFIFSIILFILLTAILLYMWELVGLIIICMSIIVSVIYSIFRSQIIELIGGVLVSVLLVCMAMFVAFLLRLFTVNPTITVIIVSIGMIFLGIFHSMYSEHSWLVFRLTGIAVIIVISKQITKSGEITTGMVYFPICGYVIGIIIKYFNEAFNEAFDKERLNKLLINKKRKEEEKKILDDFFSDTGNY